MLDLLPEWEKLHGSGRNALQGTSWLESGHCSTKDFNLRFPCFRNGSGTHRYSTSPASLALPVRFSVVPCLSCVTFASLLMCSAHAQPGSKNQGLKNIRRPTVTASTWGPFRNSLGKNTKRPFWSRCQGEPQQNGAVCCRAAQVPSSARLALQSTPPA